MMRALGALGVALASGGWVAPGCAPRVRPRAAPPLCTLHSPFPSPELPQADGGAPGYQSSSWPVRTMVFIDGSWLYYSFHGRRPNCPVTRAYGAGWEYGYALDYDRLTQLIAQKRLRHLNTDARWRSIGCDQAQVKKGCVRITRIRG